MIRNAGVSDAPNRPPQSPAPAFRFGNRILCISDGALVFSGCMPELSRGFALHLTVSILGNCCGTWPENAPKPENRFKRATNIAGLSFSDHRCIRLDQAVILDPGWPKMAQGVRNGTHFSAQHGVHLQDGGQGGGRGFQVWCCKVAFRVRRGALELVFMLPNQAWGCNHPCACLHARMRMCHFWIRHPTVDSLDPPEGAGSVLAYLLWRSLKLLGLVLRRPLSWPAKRGHARQQPRKQRF